MTNYAYCPNCSTEYRDEKVPQTDPGQCGECDTFMTDNLLRSIKVETHERTIKYQIYKWQCPECGTDKQDEFKPGNRDQMLCEECWYKSHSGPAVVVRGGAAFIISESQVQAQLNAGNLVIRSMPLDRYEKAKGNEWVEVEDLPQ